MLTKEVSWVNKNDLSQLVNSITLNYLPDDAKNMGKESREHCQVAHVLASCAQLHRRHGQYPRKNPAHVHMRRALTVKPSSEADKRERGAKFSGKLEGEKDDDDSKV